MISTSAADNPEFDPKGRVVPRSSMISKCSKQQGTRTCLTWLSLDPLTCQRSLSSACLSRQDPDKHRQGHVHDPKVANAADEFPRVEAKPMQR
jgi:hypothetical protein